MKKTERIEERLEVKHIKGRKYELRAYRLLITQTKEGMVKKEELLGEDTRYLYEPFGIFKNSEGYSQKWAHEIIRIAEIWQAFYDYTTIDFFRIDDALSSAAEKAGRKYPKTMRIL